MSFTRFHLLENLVQYPKEDLDKEYKSWLDLETCEGKADLAKGLIALANHGGGYLVIGFKQEENGNLSLDEARPANLNNYGQDVINGIIQRYADPVFHCECHLITNPENQQEYPIIIVPGGNKTPIRTKRGGPNGRYFNQNTYLIRRPGPKSESPQAAQEWSDLLNRCIMNGREELLEKMRVLLTESPSQIVENQADSSLDEWMEKSLNRFGALVEEKLPDEDPSRYSHGKWCVGYIINGDFDNPNLTDFNTKLRESQGNETGWPVWLYSVSHSPPYPFEGTIERLIVPQTYTDGAYSDYWRASPTGKLFLLRGYQEDSSNRYDPGTVLDFTLPIWRIGECILHSGRLANRLSEDPVQITFNAIWDGLKDRKLVSWASNRYFFFRGGKTHTEKISSKVTFTSNQIESNFPEIVNKILKPLYEAFDFYSLPMDTLIYELKRLRKQI